MQESHITSPWSIGNNPFKTEFVNPTTKNSNFNQSIPQQPKSQQNYQQQQQQEQYKAQQQQIQSTIRKTDSETFSLPRPNPKQVPSNIQIKSRQQRLNPNSPIFRKVKYLLFSVFKSAWMGNTL